jgi:TIR domain
MATKFRYDVFISHASEDKDSIVFPLASILERLGVKLWYDQFELKVGDSLSRSIDKGLAHSKYGIVIISPFFLKKDWPEYELRGLTSKEIGGKKVILPIWHNITRDDLLKYSPTLADKLSLDTSKNSIYEIAFRIVQVVRPDIYDRFHRAMIQRRLEEQNTRIEKVPIESIKLTPPRHASLPHNIIVRIRINQKIFAEVLPISLEETIYHFRCDTDYEKELEIWERMAAAYLEAIDDKSYDLAKKTAIFGALLDRTSGPFSKGDYSKFPPLSVRDVKRIEKLLLS